MEKLVVIGSGFGGLSAALRMRKKGYEVTLVEAQPDLGGRARVFRKDGFHFDAGPTVITAPYLIDELFEMFGKDSKDYLELLPVDPFYRVVFDDGREFDYVGDEERLFEQIRKFNPDDVEGYKKLAEHAKRIFDVGYVQLADKPFSNVADMIKVIPQMVSLQNYKSVYSLVSKYIKSPELRQVFTFEPLLVGGNPMSITSIYLLIHWLERKWGVYFPKGGTGALVNALAKLMEEEGIKIKTSAAVEKIETDDAGKVQAVLLKTGERLECDKIVSNADPSTVYHNMVDEKFRSKHSNKKIEKRHPSMSLFVAYFGTNKKFENLKHHTILLGPRYKGLLEDIFDKKVLADDFSLYLHAPARSDEGMAPDGKDSFYVLSPVPNNTSGIDWDVEGPKYMDKIMKHLDERHMPGLLDSLETSFYITPDYFQKEMQSFGGSAFGLEPRFTQSAYFRYHNRSEEIDGLYFVGASTHPGAGVPGVLNSAKVLDKVIPSLNV
ncbi:MAG: phytoene desaturase [Bdellovibrionales bacterium]